MLLFYLGAGECVRFGQATRRAEDILINFNERASLDVVVARIAFEAVGVNIDLWSNL